MQNVEEIGKKLCNVEYKVLEVGECRAQEEYYQSDSAKNSNQRIHARVVGCCIGRILQNNCHSFRFVG